MIENILSVLLVFCAGLVVFSRKITDCLVYMGIFSLILSLSYFVLKAPDLALAEAALGSGLSVLVYMITIKKTGG